MKLQINSTKQAKQNMEREQLSVLEFELFLLSEEEAEEGEEEAEKVEKKQKKKREERRELLQRETRLFFSDGEQSHPKQ